MVRYPLLVLGSALLLGASADAQTTREVSYTEQSVVPIHAKLRFTTMIILPDQEEILDFVCGDKEFWIVSGGQNLAYVKPAKAGATTNLNLITASGNVYSFLLTERSTSPDLKLYVTPAGPMRQALKAPPKFYSAAQVEQLQRQIEDTQRDAREARQASDATKDAAKRETEEAINRFRAAYPTQLQFPYRFKAHEPPFDVSAIYHDGAFTYIRTHGAELSSLYELRDGAPNLVNFQVEHGVYVVPKVLARGYLTIGKQRLPFEKVDEPGGRRVSVK